jgi:tetratricopeptide (TPR) repeat protein
LERRSKPLNHAIALLAIACLCGCHPAPAAPKVAGAVVSAQDSKDWASPEAVDTDPGPLAVTNLEGERESFTKLLDSPPQRAFGLQGLVVVLTARAQFLGIVEDYDLALTDAEALVPLRPKDPKAYLARAQARSSLHLFAAALEDLDQAAELGPTLRDAVELQRAGILNALGHTGQAVEIYRRHAAVKADMSTLGALALAVADQGKVQEADELLTKAPLGYFQGSPFPVAWTEFQRGQLWERQGQPAKAIGYYREATKRLPEYAVAQAHLAGLLAAEGRRDQGVAILREVTRSATDPEFVGQLAGLLEEAGQKDEAAKDRAAAAAGFEKLLGKHPEAFADHAARFYLGPGVNPKRALELAKLNLRDRQSPDAFDLGLTAALEAGDGATACAMEKQAAATMETPPTPHLGFLEKKAGEGCLK